MKARGAVDQGKVPPIRIVHLPIRVQGEERKESRVADITRKPPVPGWPVCQIAEVRVCLLAEEKRVARAVGDRCESARWVIREQGKHEVIAGITYVLHGLTSEIELGIVLGVDLEGLD